MADITKPYKDLTKVLNGGKLEDNQPVSGKGSGAGVSSDPRDTFELVTGDNGIAGFTIGRTKVVGKYDGKDFTPEFIVVTKGKEEVLVAYPADASISVIDKGGKPHVSMTITEKATAEGYMNGENTQAGAAILEQKPGYLYKGRDKTYKDVEITFKPKADKAKEQNEKDKVEFEKQLERYPATFKEAGADKKPYLQLHKHDFEADGKRFSVYVAVRDDKVSRYDPDARAQNRAGRVIAVEASQGNAPGVFVEAPRPRNPKNPKQDEIIHFDERSKDLLLKLIEDAEKKAAGMGAGAKDAAKGLPTPKDADSDDKSRQGTPMTGGKAGRAH